MPPENENSAINPTHRSREEILGLLKAATFDALIGTLESEQVDFKEQPYLLDSEHQKYCLIEDVASFANRQGGIIVVGCQTEKADVAGEYVCKVHPIPKDLLNLNSYRSICTNHIYPPIKGLRFVVYDSPSDPSKCLLVIEIPPGSPVDRPHLLAHVLKEDEKKKTTRYALVERTGPENLSYTVQAFHSLVRIGSSLSSFEGALRSIEKSIQSLKDGRESETPLRVKPVSHTSNARRFSEETVDLLKACDLSERAALVMGAAPSDRVRLDSIFDGESELSRAFDNAPEIRANGFTFRINKPAEIVDGKYRRKAYPGYKAAQISSSGRLMVAVPADEEFLAWAQQRKPGRPVSYRSYVLAEVTHLFAKWLKSVFSLVKPLPNYIDIAVALRNGFVDGIPPVLSVAPDHNQWRFGIHEPHSAPRANLLKTSRLPLSSSTERFAFEVRACLYRRFGFGDELLPYATLEKKGE